VSQLRESFTNNGPPSPQPTPHHAIPSLKPPASPKKTPGGKKNAGIKKKPPKHEIPETVEEIDGKEDEDDEGYYKCENWWNGWDWDQDNPDFTLDSEESSEEEKTPSPTTRRKLLAPTSPKLMVPGGGLSPQKRQTPMRPPVGPVLTSSNPLTGSLSDTGPMTAGLDFEERPPRPEPPKMEVKKSPVVKRKQPAISNTPQLIVSPSPP